MYEGASRRDWDTAAPLIAAVASVFREKNKHVTPEQINPWKPRRVGGR